jgi:hypothetical protein
MGLVGGACSTERSQPFSGPVRPSNEKKLTCVWRVTGSALCAILMSVASAGATVLVPADLGTLAREARAIVRGRVMAVTPRPTEDRRGIETLVTIQVDARIKGSLGEAVTFRVPGGRVGRYRSLVIGAPEFSPDEQVVVFLGYQGPSLPYILGLSQGVYRVTLADGQWMVTPPAIVDAGQPQRIVRGDPGRRPWMLGAFEREVRALSEGSR